MPLDLVNYEKRARESVMAFWGNRGQARVKQTAAGKSDQGERASVTGGKNMDGFALLVEDLARANGLPAATIHRKRALLTLPGYFRPTKIWDLLVFQEKQLVAAIEFKSHVGPSFGNNFNNRAEEAIGMGHDFEIACREGALGRQAPPFVGWLMLIEDAPRSRLPVNDKSPHFPVLHEFQGASYQARYDLLCQRLMREKLYSAAAVIASPRSAASTGEYAELSELTGLGTFVTLLAGHIAAVAARRG